MNWAMSTLLFMNPWPIEAVVCQAVKEVQEDEVKRAEYYKREGEEGQSRSSQLGSNCWVPK